MNDLNDKLNSILGESLSLAVVGKKKKSKRSVAEIYKRACDRKLYSMISESLMLKDTINDIIDYKTYGEAMAPADKYEADIPRNAFQRVDARIESELQADVEKRRQDGERTLFQRIQNIIVAIIKFFKELIATLFDKHKKIGKMIRAFRELHSQRPRIDTHQETEVNDQNATYYHELLKLQLALSRSQLDEFDDTYEEFMEIMHTVLNGKVQVNPGFRKRVEDLVRKIRRNTEETERSIKVVDNLEEKKFIDTLEEDKARFRRATSEYIIAQIQDCLKEISDYVLGHKHIMEVGKRFTESLDKIIARMTSLGTQSVTDDDVEQNQWRESTEYLSSVIKDLLPDINRQARTLNKHDNQVLKQTLSLAAKLYKGLQKLPDVGENS